MESKEMFKIAINALEEKKAENIRVIDISKVSVLADYFIIAEGKNRNQIQALTDSVEKDLSKAGVIPKQIEGYDSANWILMDYADIIVHIFDNENRLFYDLERIWRDGVCVDAKDFMQKSITKSRIAICKTGIFYMEIKF